jgi:hypothetical protein
MASRRQTEAMSFDALLQLTRRLRANLVGSVGADDPAARVHFHSGDHGRPYVCGNPRCTSPSLDIREGQRAGDLAT